MEKDGWGPITADFITALAQKAAPIIVTSSVLHNFIARRKIFKDFLEGRGLLYKNKYAYFSEKQAKQLETIIPAYFQENQKFFKPGNPVSLELTSFFYVMPYHLKKMIGY